MTIRATRVSVAPPHESRTSEDPKNRTQAAVETHRSTRRRELRARARKKRQSKPYIPHAAPAPTTKRSPPQRPRLPMRVHVRRTFDAFSESQRPATQRSLGRALGKLPGQIHSADRLFDVSVSQSLLGLEARRIERHDVRSHNILAHPPVELIFDDRLDVRL
jgi:hypothetical protein